MTKTVIALIVLMLSFGVVGSVFAGNNGGEPISRSKWSYNYLDGYVADRGEYYSKHMEKHSLFGSGGDLVKDNYQDSSYGNDGYLSVGMRDTGHYSR
jgi:hypothetical protein